MTVAVACVVSKKAVVAWWETKVLSPNLHSSLQPVTDIYFSPLWSPLALPINHVLQGVTLSTRFSKALESLASVSASASAPQIESKLWS